MLNLKWTCVFACISHYSAWRADGASVLGAGSPSLTNWQHNSVSLLSQSKADTRTNRTFCHARFNFLQSVQRRRTYATSDVTREVLMVCRSRCLTITGGDIRPIRRGLYHDNTCVTNLIRKFQQPPPLLLTHDLGYNLTRPGQRDALSNFARNSNPPGVSRHDKPSSAADSSVKVRPISFPSDLRTFQERIFEEHAINYLAR